MTIFFFAISGETRTQHASAGRFSRESNQWGDLEKHQRVDEMYSQPSLFWRFKTLQFTGDGQRWTSPCLDQFKWFLSQMDTHSKSESNIFNRDYFQRVKCWNSVRFATGGKSALSWFIGFGITTICFFFFVNNFVQDFETIFGDASLQCGVVSRSQLLGKNGSEADPSPFFFLDLFVGPWDSNHQFIWMTLIYSHSDQENWGDLVGQSCRGNTTGSYWKLLKTSFWGDIHQPEGNFIDPIYRRPKPMALMKLYLWMCIYVWINKMHTYNIYI